MPSPPEKTCLAFHPFPTLTALVGCPGEGAVGSSVVAIPEQIAVIHQRINDAVSPREDLLRVLPVAHLTALAGYPGKRAVVSDVEQITEQVSASHPQSDES